jgi:hypothetical protein
MLAVPPCGISQFHVGDAASVKSVFYNGATGSLSGTVTFRNLGATCGLRDPRVRFTGGPAAHVPQRQVVLRSQGPIVPKPVHHGDTVAIQILWSNWCGPKSRPASGPGPPPTHIVVTLPGGGSARLPVTQAPRCDEPNAPSTIAVSLPTAVRTP